MPTSTPPRLPVELVRFVLAEALRDDRQDLVAASTVCRAWSVLVRDLISRTVALESKAHIYEFCIFLAADPCFRRDLHGYTSALTPTNSNSPLPRCDFRLHSLI